MLLKNDWAFKNGYLEKTKKTKIVWSKYVYKKKKKKIGDQIEK